MTVCEKEFSNEQLVQRFQNGNERVFSLLIERFLPMVRAEVSRTGYHRTDGDDLAQEALLALLAAAKAFSAERGASFATFARVCVRNRLRNAVSTVVFSETPKADESLYEELDKDPALSLDPGDLLLNKEEEAALLQRLQKLLSSLEYRVLMFHLAADSYEDIASAMGISAKSVDNALQRIRRKLSHWL